jgi:hypothetical protein
MDVPGVAGVPYRTMDLSSFLESDWPISILFTVGLGNTARLIPPQIRELTIMEILGADSVSMYQWPDEGCSGPFHLTLGVIFYSSLFSSVEANEDSSGSRNGAGDTCTIRCIWMLRSIGTIVLPTMSG